MGRGLRNPDRILTCALLLLGSTLQGDEAVWAQSRDAATGSIEGTAVLGRRLTAEYKRVRVYAEPGTRSAPPAAVAHPLMFAPALAGRCRVWLLEPSQVGATLHSGSRLSRSGD